jgi:hypothetical protein
MRTKRTLTIAATLVALVAFAAFGIFRETRRVQAQTDEVPPPNHDRISFGMVGITQGQTIRLSVVNAIPYDSAFPPGPTRVLMTFLDAEGRRLRQRDGSPARRVVELQPGRAAFLDLNYDDFPPGPTRLQLRAVVNVQPPPNPDSNVPPPIPDRIVPSVEVFNNANGRTVLFIGNPGRIRGFNPQPDPPIE